MLHRFVFILIFIVSPALAEHDFSLEYTGPANIDEWLPTKVGTSWEYQEIYRTAMGLANERIEMKWTRKDTIVANHNIPQGTLIEFKCDDSDITYSPDPDEATTQSLAQRPADRHYDWLIRENYVFVLPDWAWHPEDKKLDEKFIRRLDAETVCPDFFFPMDKARFWSEPKRERAELEKARLSKQGKGPAPNPAMWFWIVVGREETTTPAGKFPDAYLLKEFFNNGPITVWFTPGIGVLKRKITHIGSFQESETILLNWKSIQD